MPKLIKTMIGPKGDLKVHAKSESGEGTCCGLRYGGWQFADDVVTCKACIKIMALKCAENNDRYDDELFEVLTARPGLFRQREIFDHIVEMLRIVRDYTIKDPDGLEAERDRFIERFYVKKKGQGELGNWEEITRKLRDLIDNDATGEEGKFFKYNTEIAGLVAAIAKVKDRTISELQLIKIGTLALTRNIELDGDIEVLSSKEADELIEWLRTVSVEE